MEKSVNFQGQFLEHLHHGRKQTTVITTNGFQLKGRLIGHDRYTILLDVDGQQQLVFKSAISTIKEG